VVKDQRVVALTDFGIIAKKSDNDINFFVNSIATANPVEGVEINLISTKQSNTSYRQNKFGRCSEVFKTLKIINQRILSRA